MTQQDPMENPATARDALIMATEVLAARVQTLADVVTTNNQKIDGLQHEVNQKPDDVEVRTLTALSDNERRLIRNRTLITCIIASVVTAIIAGVVAIWAADMHGKQRCARNQQSFNIIIEYLDTIPDPDPYLSQTIRSLKQNRNPC